MSLNKLLNTIKFYARHEKILTFLKKAFKNIYM